MAPYAIVTLVLMLLIVTASSIMVPRKPFVNNLQDISDEVLLKQLSEDGEALLPPLPSSEFQYAFASAEVEPSRFPESWDSLLNEPVVDVERMAAALGEHNNLEKVKVLPSPGVIGPVVRDAEKERGLRARDIGPKPLNKWLDSLVGEARRVVWSVGPRLRG